MVSRLLSPGFVESALMTFGQAVTYALAETMSAGR